MFVCVGMFVRVRSLTPLAKPLVVFREKLCPKTRVDPSGLPSTLKSHKQHCKSTSVSITMCAEVSVGVFFCVPGNYEGSACTGLNTSSCTDITWGLNAGRRHLCHIVNVCINA